MTLMTCPSVNTKTILDYGLFQIMFCLSKVFWIWYFVTKIFLTYCEKKCFGDREKLLKFEAERQEFAKVLRSLEQFIQTVKGQNNFW